MEIFRASYKNLIFKGQLWRFGQKRAVLVRKLPQLTAEYFIRPHPGAGHWLPLHVSFREFCIHTRASLILDLCTSQ